MYISVKCVFLRNGVSDLWCSIGWVACVFFIKQLMHACSLFLFLFVCLCELRERPGKDSLIPTLIIGKLCGLK